jgi:hypothetical protein
MPEEVTKSLEEELDEIDDVGDIYEDEESDEETSDESEAESEAEIETTEEESDGEKKGSEEESAGEETSEETDTSGEAESDEKKEGKAESEASKDLDGQQRIANLIAEVDRLSGLLVTQTPAVKLDSPEAKPKLDTETIKLPEVEDFIGDLDMDDVASNSEILNEILNKVLQKGIETGKSLSATQTDASTAIVSQTVASQVESTVAIKDLIDKFYGANPELSNVKQVVQACASQIVQDSPDKSFKDVLNMAADAARKTLGIPKSTKKTKIAKVEDAAFAEQKGGQRKKARKVSKLQQELDEL